MKGWRAFLGGRFGGLFVLGVGLAGLYVASRLTFGEVQRPGPGFYPVLVCALLVAFSILSLLKSEPREAEPSVPGGSDGRIWMVVAALAIYAWALPRIGFVLCTVLLLLLLLRGVGRVSWKGSAASAVIGSIACYAAFVKLGLPLPAGVLPF